MKDKIITLKH